MFSLQPFPALCDIICIVGYCTRVVTADVVRLVVPPERDYTERFVVQIKRWKLFVGSRFCRYQSGDACCCCCSFRDLVFRLFNCGLSILWRVEKGKKILNLPDFFRLWRLSCLLWIGASNYSYAAPVIRSLQCLAPGKKEEAAWKDRSGPFRAWTAQRFWTMIIAARCCFALNSARWKLLSAILAWPSCRILGSSLQRNTVTCYVQLSWTLWHSPQEKKSMTSSRTELGLDLHSHAVQCGHEANKQLTPSLGANQLERLNWFSPQLSSTLFVVMAVFVVPGMVVLVIWVWSW